jgi:hypothetical protein
MVKQLILVVATASHRPITSSSTNQALLAFGKLEITLEQ